MDQSVPLAVAKGTTFTSKSVDLCQNLYLSLTSGSFQLLLAGFYGQYTAQSRVSRLWDYTRLRLL